MPATRSRLDSLLAERGLFSSRTAAARAIRAGHVKLGVDGPIATKPSQDVPASQELEILDAPRFVSRGGVKLANALEILGLDVAGMSCLDVGASTGGFTDCLLKAGARRIACVDVAYGQIDQGLRDDPRVDVIERTNARELRPETVPFEADLATIDVSFISLGKVIGPVAGCLAGSGTVLAMVKPQFELGRGRVGRGGVVRDAGDRREAVLAVARGAGEAGLEVLGIAPSGLPGPKGNRETFLHLGRRGAGGDGARPIDDLEETVAGVDL